MWANFSTAVLAQRCTRREHWWWLLSQARTFFDENPIACEFATGECELHRRSKLEVYEALLREPNVRDVAIERSFENFRPDVSAVINGVPVAIEVQISSLSLDTIQRRTMK